MIELRVAEMAVKEWSEQALFAADLQRAFQDDAWRNIVPGLPVVLKCTSKLASDVAFGAILVARQVCLGLMALSSFGGAFGIIFYAKSTFELAGLSGTVGSIAIGLIQLPPAVVCVMLMDKFGRRSLLMFSGAGMGIGTLSLAISFSLRLFAATFPLGMGGIPFVIMSEIFPKNIKGAAGSLATVVSFVSSWIVRYAFNFMMD